MTACLLAGCGPLPREASDKLGQLAWSPDGSCLAFVGSRTGGMARVYLIDTAAQPGAVRLALTAWTVNGPVSWRPDSSELAVAGFDLGVRDWVGRVWVVPAERGRKVRKVAKGAQFWFPEWSPDGTRLAYTESQTAYECGLLVSTLDGHTEKVVEGPGTWLFLQWSPDGKHISYQSAASRTRAVSLGITRGLHICSPDGSVRPLVGAWMDLGPVVRAGGTAGQCQCAGTGQPSSNSPGLWSLNLATGAKSLLLARDKLPHELKGGSPVPRWHRGTRQLLYSGTDEKPVAKPQAEPAPTAETPPSLSPGASTPPDYTYHIYRADLSAGQVRQLTSGPNSDTEPCWSPDGSRIAFVRNKTELWTMASDGSNQQKLLSVDELPL